MIDNWKSNSVSVSSILLSGQLYKPLDNLITLDFVIKLYFFSNRAIGNISSS